MFVEGTVIASTRSIATSPTCTAGRVPRLGDGRLQQAIDEAREAG